MRTRMTFAAAACLAAPPAAAQVVHGRAVAAADSAVRGAAFEP